MDAPGSTARLDDVRSKIRDLVPGNDEQRGLRSRTLDIAGEMSGTRWLLIMQRKGSISTPVLVVMTLWLSLIFAAWGVFSPRNLIVVAAFFASAIAVAGATFLILEMDQPLTGWIRVSPTAMLQALAHLGQ